MFNVWLPAVLESRAKGHGDAAIKEALGDFVLYSRTFFYQRTTHIAELIQMIDSGRMSGFSCKCFTQAYSPDGADFSLLGRCVDGSNSTRQTEIPSYMYTVHWSLDFCVHPRRTKVGCGH